MIVLGIDPSYKNTGISIAIDNKLIMVSSLSLAKYKTNAKRRQILRGYLATVMKEYNPDYIIVERVRQFSNSFMNIKVIGALATLIALIVDVAFLFDKEVFSVDTRAWKTQVVGSIDKTAKDKKLATKEFVKKQVIESFLNDDDDACDSACIALYGFIPEVDKKLKAEQ